MTVLRNRGRGLAVLGALAVAGLGSAHATSVDFGVAYRSGGDTLLESAWARVGVDDLNVLGGAVRLGASTRAGDAAYTRTLAVPPLGAVTSTSSVAVTYSGGVRLASRATATLGPVALDVGGSYFTASAGVVDPLAVWSEAAVDQRDRGWTADATARYRVNRTLVAVVGGEFGAQPQGLAGVEIRRDLTRTLPPAEDDDPAAPPETEVTGTVTWRVGARVGRNVLGATAGVSYGTPQGLNLRLDGLLGPDSVGVSASAGAADVLGEGSTLRVYGAYEPWRTVGTPLRAGVEVTVPVGSGTLGLNVSGGRDLSRQAGVAARATYRLELPGREP